MNKYYNNKAIVILGPTSSGKSDVAIRLAKKFNGEIISADSRQIYRGMNVGTGKVPGHIVDNNQTRVFISENIPHYMIDIISPRTNFSAAQFKKKADKIIAHIIKRGKLPIICGGTGFWIKSIVDNITYPEVKPDWVLRNKLRNKSAEELFLQLKKLDSQRSKNIDSKNKVRLIRAIEICKSLGKVPDTKCPIPDTKYQFLQIGILLPKEKLYEKIKERLNQRWRQGMIEEIKKLHFKQKLSWKKIESFGLGYFWIPKYLKGEVTIEELKEKVYLAEKNYAKRQLTWFKKDKRIVWLEKYGDIKSKVLRFISS